MDEQHGRHPDDDQMEEYSLGLLSPTEIPGFEQHVMGCPNCQDRVAEMDAHVQGMQAAAKELRAQEVRKRSRAGGCN